MTYDTRTSSFVVPEESMRLAEDQIKNAIRHLRRLSAQMNPENEQALNLAEDSLLKAMEYIGLYSGQHKVHELDVRER